jgi:hypothetical protein
MREDNMPSPREAYAGCDAKLPVMWCQTSGKNHDRQDALAAPAFWSFFSGLNEAVFPIEGGSVRPMQR